MSTTYTLVCDDCKQKYWAGQASHCGRYLYESDHLANFLFGHAHHRLRFLNDHCDNDDILDYSDYEKLQP